MLNAARSAFLSVAVTAPCLAAQGSRPDVLFIAVDDLNDWVGVLDGHPQARTPNIDALARRGTLFTNAHCTAPGCAPSRASLLTGVRPSTSGVYSNDHDWRECKALAEAVTLPMHFKQSGYRTLGAGKIFHAHTITEEALTGFSQPEAWHDYFPSMTQQLPEELKPDGWPVRTTRTMYDGHFDWSPMGIRDDEMADGQVVAWAERALAADRAAGAPPMFLAVGIYRPHVPWYVPQVYFDRFPLDEVRLPKTGVDDLGDLPDAARELAFEHWHDWIVENGEWRRAVQGYLASLAFADAMVGRLVRALDASPRAKNTLIVLWSDHGYHLGEKRHWEKFALWEDTTHVPLIVVDPREPDRAGQVCREPVSLLDLYPTLLGLCGLDAPPQSLEGHSLEPQLADPAKDTARCVLTTSDMGNHAVRGDRYRYIRYRDGSEELYDHEGDPHEWRNLASDPELAAVKEELAKWLPKVDAPAMGEEEKRN